MSFNIDISINQTKNSKSKSNQQTKNSNPTINEQSNATLNENSNSSIPFNSPNQECPSNTNITDNIDQNVKRTNSQIAYPDSKINKENFEIYESILIKENLNRKNIIINSFKERNMEENMLTFGTNCSDDNQITHPTRNYQYENNFNKNVNPKNFQSKFLIFNYDNNSNVNKQSKLNLFEKQDKINNKDRQQVFNNTPSQNIEVNSAPITNQSSNKSNTTVFTFKKDHKIPKVVNEINQKDEDDQVNLGDNCGGNSKVNEIDLNTVEQGVNKFKGINDIFNKQKSIVSNLNNKKSGKQNKKLQNNKSENDQDNTRNVTPEINNSVQKDKEIAKLNCINFDNLLKDRENNNTPLSDNKMISRENIDNNIRLLKDKKFEVRELTLYNNIKHSREKQKSNKLNNLDDNHSDKDTTIEFKNEKLKHFSSLVDRKQDKSFSNPSSTNNKKDKSTKIIHIRPPMLPTSKNIINLNVLNIKKETLNSKLKKLNSKKVFNNSFAEIRNKQQKNVVYRIDNVHDQVKSLGNIDSQIQIKKTVDTRNIFPML